MKKYNLGGLIEDLVPVEVEGDEVFETPAGELKKVKGPKHEKGGVPMDLPADTMVYSDAIKGPDGKSMAERKLARARALAYLDEEDPFNAIAKNTRERVQLWAEQQEQADQFVMELTNELDAVMKYGGKVKRKGRKRKMSNGGQIFGDAIQRLLQSRKMELQEVPELSPTVGAGNKINIDPLPGITPKPTSTTPKTPLLDGIMGLLDSESGPAEVLGKAAMATGPLGAAIGTFAPLLTTILSGTGGKNQNPYQGFGNDALASLDEAERGIEGSRDLAIAENTLATEDQLSQIRGNTSSAGVARATSQGAIASRIRGNNKATTQFSDRLSRLLTQRAQTELRIDDKVMRGADTATVRDTQDRDNFFTNISSDLRNVGTGLMFQDSQKEEVDILKILGL